MCKHSQYAHNAYTKLGTIVVPAILFMKPVTAWCIALISHYTLWYCPFSLTFPLICCILFDKDVILMLLYSINDLFIWQEPFTPSSLYLYLAKNMLTDPPTPIQKPCAYCMTDGSGDVAMDDHVSIHDQVRSLELVPPPVPCPPLNVPLAQAPIESPAPPVSTPATPIDSIESKSVQPGSQANGELVGYSSSTSLSSEMN